jgi:hypothetical protein
VILKLPDNSGWREVQIQVTPVRAVNLDATIRLTSHSFDSPSSSRCTLRHVPIARVRLQQLATFLESWLNEPEPFAVDLIDDRWETFEFSVGDDTTKGLQKPACEVRYNWAGMGGIFEIYLDQSCIRLFHGDVMGCLRLCGTREAE